MNKIQVKLENPYTIYIDIGMRRKIRPYLKALQLGNFALIVTSVSVYALYKEVMRAACKDIAYAVVIVPDGEAAKTKRELFRVIDKLIEIEALGRKCFLVCWGGGTVGDVGSFSASIYKRGIPYIQVPTTLLSQIDASIGGKTAIDMDHAKNSLGTIYQPRAVFIDPEFLKTLPLSSYKEGISEAVKYGIIKDKRLFYFLKQNHEKILARSMPHVCTLITRCVAIKAVVVEKDPYEKKGVRTILNFGHTLAHALEAGAQYRELSHGAAVSLGMVYAGYLSFLLGFCHLREVDEIREILGLFSLPVAGRFASRAVLKHLCYDKKFISGNIRMVVVTRIGEVRVVEPIPLKIVQKAFKILTSIN